MSIDRRSMLRGAAANPVLAAGARRALAQAAPLRIGMLTDLSGVHRDIAGPTSVACVRQAVQDSAAAEGLSVEVLSAKHRNKPDVGAGIARQWFDRDGVDMITDVPNSGDGRLDHAEHPISQHRRLDDDDRGEGRRHDPRPSSAEGGGAGPRVA